MKHLLTLKYIDAVARTRSIRAAAESVSITPSALNRRILSVEEELGVEIFERTSKGVRLNSAGELFVQHIRSQLADLERVRSRIADLKGMRLGHVRIAATPEIARRFLPAEIQKYRSQFPGVTFEIQVSDRLNVEQALTSQISDLAIILEPTHISEFHTLIRYGQQIHCFMKPDHKLANRKSIGLMECLEYELLLPPRGNGIREILETATSTKQLIINPVICSNNLTLLEQIACQGNGIGFTIPLDVGQSNDGTPLCYVPLDIKDVPLSSLFVGQLRFRTLPVAVAKFVEDLRAVIENAGASH